MDKQVHSESYDDIINLPHHRSTKHPPMPVADRAAQFMPFAALTGYDASIKEEARLTERKLELDDDAITILNERLQLIREMLPNAPEIAVTYFVPDQKKEGGAYLKLTGRVKQVDPVKSRLVMQGGTAIPFGHILRIDMEENGMLKRLMDEEIFADGGAAE